ncbi:MAG: M48 family metalloprotease [Desulfococcaceae bacterium]
MFGNFIYFVVVLLLYTTYPPAESPRFGPVETATLLILLYVAYASFCRLQFQRVENRIHRDGFSRLDHDFSRIQTRMSVAAIGLFAVDLYGLHLVEHTRGVHLLDAAPTLRAFLFIGLFLLYLMIMWATSHRVYVRLYGSRISRRGYVLSNAAFSAPVLLPWLILSGVADLIGLLPFAAPKAFLETAGGQTLYFLVFLILVALLGPLLIQRFWRCHPLEPGYFRSRIERLCARAGLGYADILYWPIFEGRMITAGVMGLVRRFRYILVTEALLEVLKPEEVDAVIAHEIGHVKRHHLLFYLFFFVGYLVLSYATFDLILYGVLYAEPAYRVLVPASVSQTAAVSGLFTVISVSLFLFYFRFVFGYFMRNFERQADVYVYQFFDSAAPLISTFEKIVLTSGQSPEKPNWHHFSIAERIDYLLRCERDRGWIVRQNRKIRKSIALYAAGILVLATGGYALNFGETGERLGAGFLERMLEREIDRNPTDPGLYRMLGDLHYERERFVDARRAYERAVALNPEAPAALNNLAWLLTGADAPDMREPERSLAYARRAVKISDAAHVLDTLAEAYYVNGKYEDALRVGRQALSRAEGDRSHYRSQLRKFRSAAGNRRRNGNG